MSANPSAYTVVDIKGIKVCYQSRFKIIFNTQEVFMGIIPDMLPNKIYINRKNELTLENKQLPFQHLSFGMTSQWT